MKKKRIMDWQPDLLKELKHYSVSYQPPKGERVKIKISTPHKIGSPEFNQHVHFEAGKAGHKGGMISGCQEIVQKSKMQKLAMLSLMLSDSKKGKSMEKKKKIKPKRFIQPGPADPLKRLGMLGAKLQLEKPRGSYKQFVAQTEGKKDVKKMEQKIEGGLADDSEPTDFDAAELRMGIEVEMEHTNDPDKAKEIAMDHLKEIPDYYTRLKAMEEKANKDGMKDEEVEKAKTADWAPKHPEVFGESGREHKIGQIVGFKDDEGNFKEGNITDIRGEKLHVRDAEGNVHRVLKDKLHLPIKKIDCAHIELMYKSIQDDWLLRLGDEFKSIAKAAGILFKTIQLPSAAIRQYVFKIGDCAVVHKTLGRLIDIKCHSTIESPQSHQKLAKALFYRLQMYYHKNPALGVEKHMGPISMGIFKATLYGGQYARPWQEGLAGQLNRRRKVTLGRKRRPQMGSRKPKSLQEFREQRVSARLMGQQEERKNVGKSLTPFGKEFFKKTIKKLREKTKKSAIAPSKPTPEKASIDTPKASGLK